MSFSRSIPLVRLQQKHAIRFFSSTSATQYAAPSSSPGRKVRVRVVSNKKKGKPSTGPGSLLTFKEMTTRLPLNKDAPELDLPEIKPQGIEINSAYAYSNIKELHHLGSFNKYQYNELWRSPFSIARKDVTLPLLDFYKKTLKADSSKKNRMIIMGEIGVGKTTAIAQFQSIAKSQNAVIIPFNDCTKLIDGTNDYMLDQESGLYHQPMFLNSLFNKLKRGNSIEFTAIKLSKAYKFQQYSLSTKNNVLDLINIGKRLKNVQKFGVWQALIEELSTQKQFPVYLTIDNFSAILKRPFTNYRDAANNFIYFDQFTLGKFLIDHISGAASFGSAKGGVLIGTTGGRQKKTLTVALGLEPFDAYAKVTDFDKKLATYLASGGLQVLNVPKFDKEELNVLLEKMLENNILKNDALEDQERLLDGKYVLSGNGNPREFYKSCVLRYY